jgi:hypothetical protein
MSSSDTIHHLLCGCRWAAVICGAFAALTFYGAELVSDFARSRAFFCALWMLLF